MNLPENDRDGLDDAAEEAPLTRIFSAVFNVPADSPEGVVRCLHSHEREFLSRPPESGSAGDAVAQVDDEPTGQFERPIPLTHRNAIAPPPDDGSWEQEPGTTIPAPAYVDTERPSATAEWESSPPTNPAAHVPWTDAAPPPALPCKEEASPAPGDADDACRADADDERRTALFEAPGVLTRPRTQAVCGQEETLPPAERLERPALTFPCAGDQRAQGDVAGAPPPLRGALSPWATRTPPLRRDVLPSARRLTLVRAAFASAIAVLTVILVVTIALAVRR